MLHLHLHSTAFFGVLQFCTPKIKSDSTQRIQEFREKDHAPRMAICGLARQELAPRDRVSPHIKHHVPCTILALNRDAFQCVAVVHSNAPHASTQIHVTRKVNRGFKM